MRSYIRSKGKAVLTLVAILLFVSVAGAAENIENISLKRQGSFTELTVYSTGPVDYEHQIVEPGAGKPYRVALDLKGSLHKLPHYNFNDLPSQSITSIRTSQFSVKPEEIVRVVLDVRGNVTYKVKESGNRVSLLISTPNDKEYPFWCAQPLSEAEKIQLALTNEMPETKEPEKTSDKLSDKPPVLVSNTVWNDDSGPTLPSGTPEANKDKNIDKATTPSEQKMATAEKAVLGTPLFEQYPEFEFTDDPAEEKAVAKASSPEMTMPRVSPAPLQPGQNTYAENSVSKNTESTPKTHEALEEKSRKPEAKPKADTEAADEMDEGVMTPGMPETDKLSDSGMDDQSRPILPHERIEDEKAPAKDKGESEDAEFRKNPAGPTKTSGTLAGRFPKRKVIKYQSWGRRDPFTALIDKSLAGYEPGEPPNVETLRLVGVLKSNDGSSALLEDLEGYGYILKDGDKVQNGYVVQIGTDKIIFQIREYGWSRTIALKLESDEN